MKGFQELDPEVARKAIEGYEDELDSEARSLDRLYASFSCPRGCGSLHRENDTRHAFADPTVLVPRSLLRCKNCGFLIEPHTRMLLESGNAGKIPVESSPLILPGRKMVGNQ